MEAGRHHPAEQRRRGEARLPVLVEHDLGDAHRRVQPDEVEQRERAHRVAAAELHAAVDVGRGRHALLQRPHRVEQIGHQQAVHDEARPVAGDDRLLAEPPRRRPSPARTSRAEVVTARTTSTSGMSGTGLKKWRPTNRSGRPVAAAMSPIERLEVLEAKIVAGGHAASSARQSSVLSCEVLGDRLDDEVAAAEVGQVGGEA